MTINLEKSLEIDAPIDQVYEQWSDFNAYPRFMPHVREVQPLDGNRWTWQAERDGQSATWHVDITGQEPGQSISWRTSSPDVNSTSSVQLTALDDGARTGVLFTSHYPQGVGPSNTALQIAAEMEQGLARFAALLAGTSTATATEADQDDQPDQGIQTKTLGQPDTDDAKADDQAPIAHLEQTLETATDALVGSVIKAFDSPLTQWGQMIWDMEKQFTDFIWGNLDNRRVSAFSGPGTWSPSFAMERQGDLLLASADLPGYTSDHLHVEIRDGRLLVSGERQLPVEDGHPDRVGVGREERFKVSIGLSAPVDSQHVDARLTERGRLEISLPIKQATAQAEPAKLTADTAFWGT